MSVPSVILLLYIGMTDSQWLLDTTVRSPFPFSVTRPLRRNGIQPDSNYLLALYVPQDQDRLDYPLDVFSLLIIITGRSQFLDPHLLDSPLRCSLILS
jgi:hypothetical protein